MGDANFLMICGGGASCHHENWSHDHPVRCQLPEVRSSYHIGHTCNENKQLTKRQNHQVRKVICVRHIFIFINVIFLQIEPFARQFVVNDLDSSFLRCACSWLELVYTPPIFITRRLPLVSHETLAEVLGSVRTESREGDATKQKSLNKTCFWLELVYTPPISITRRLPLVLYETLAEVLELERSLG